MSSNLNNKTGNLRPVSEHGHAKNVTNFNTLIGLAESFGSSYNPSKLALQLPQLYTVLIIAQDKLASVAVQNTAYNNVVCGRREAFKGLQELSEKIVSALESCCAKQETIAMARQYDFQLQGKQTVENQRLRLTYDQAVQLFAALVALVENELDYHPSEESLQPGRLKQMQEWLIQQNKAKIQAFNAIKNVRIERNMTLYQSENGLIAIAEEVKKHIEQVFGYSSQQFKQANKLRFKKPRQ